MSKNAFCKDFTKLYTLLVEAVYVPQESLEHNFVFEVSKKCTEACRIYLLADDDAGRTCALKILVAVLIRLTAGKCHDLSCNVRAELLLARASLNHNIVLQLAVLEADKLMSVP